MAFEERYMVPTILQIDIRIEMRYKNYTEMHLTKCDAIMNTCTDVHMFAYVV